jgi:hypothetical protein
VITYQQTAESDILTHIEGRNCVEFIRNIECQDAIAEAMYNQFVDMLSRMDCHKPYSVSKISSYKLGLGKLLTGLGLKKV